MEKGGKMFGKNYFENGIIRIVIGITIFAALLSTAQAGDWPMFRHDAAHSGVADEIVEPPHDLFWKYKYTAGVYVDSSPVVSGGIVYMGSHDNNVYAFDAATGALLWNYTTGSYAVSTPAVSSGVVYVGSYDNNVYALDAATGALKWEFSTNGGPVSSSPAVSGGMVYVGSHNNSIEPGNVYALDAATGILKWKYTTGGDVYSSPAVSGGVVYVGSVDKNVYALDAATGVLKWKYTTGGWVDSSPAVSGGVVYVGSWDKNVYALDAATGALKWNYTTGGDVHSSPAVSGGVIYVGSGYPDPNVYALDAATGTLKWKYNPQRPGVAGPVSSSPAVSGGVVYVGSDNYNLYALDAITGTLKWEYTTEGSVSSSPAVSGGVVYVGSTDGFVYAFASNKINNCTVISSPGEYVLTTDIINSANITCISITSNDVVFDGNGHTIDGVIGTSTTYGVHVYNPNVSLSNVIVKNLTVTDWYFGILLEFSSNSKLIGNTANSNYWDGILVGYSGNNMLMDNTASNNQAGIYLAHSNSNMLSGNNVSSNKLEGIVMDNSSSNTLSGNMANSRSYHGIDMRYSDYNTLSGNTANSNSRDGFRISSSSNNNLTNNNASKNKDFGIYLFNSSDNKLIGNTAESNNNETNSNLGKGINLEDSNNNLLNGNNAWNNFHGLSLISSSGNALSGNNVSNSDVGIYILSNHNMLSGNNVFNNSWGIWLKYASDNTLSGNNISDNGLGIALRNPSNNTIYNNYFNNFENFFFDQQYSIGSNYWNTAKTPAKNIARGPNLGGNFWSYPNGTGHSKTCADADGDGICDLPYVLDANNTDNLPLAAAVPSGPGSPSITSASPSPTVMTAAGAPQTFDITMNQSVNVTWFINGTIVQDTEKNLMTASYTNTSGVEGVWNMTAAVSNANGSDTRVWTWIVTPPIPASQLQLVVADLNAKAIFGISTTGQITTISNHPLLTAPNGIARLASGSYIVSNSRSGTSASLLRVETNGTTSAIVSGLPTFGIIGLAVDAQGDFIVGNSHCFDDNQVNCSLMKITANGVVTTIFTFPGIIEPRAIAIDSNGNYIVATVQGQIWKITPQGNSTILAGPPEILNAFGIVIDSDGNYLVTDGNSKAIRKVTPTGLVSTVISNNSWGRLIGIAIDPNKNIVVIDELLADVYAINSQGQIKLLYSGSPLITPYGIALLTEAPNITTTTPSSPVATTEGAPQTFSIIINQLVNVTWLINGTVVQNTEKNVMAASYTNTSGAEGIWNVTADVSNVNGSDTWKWTWIVTPPSTYVPPAPTITGSTRRNFWINHTWQAGAGSKTDSYNVSVNGVWTNGTALTYYNITVGAHNWSNITVWAYNNSGSGKLSLTSASNATQVANNKPVQAAIGNKAVIAGTLLQFAVSATDADSDAITYSTTASKGNLNPATGLYTWTPGNGDVGVYTWSFNSSDSFGGVSPNETITVTVGIPPDTTPPAGVTGLTNTSYAPNFINWTWKDPADADFSHVEVYIDGNFKKNVLWGIQYYNAAGLTAETEHTVSTRTVDTAGNVNQTWINSTARTSISYTPIVITITSMVDNSSGNVSITATLDRPGTAILNWEGINESMDGGGTSFYKNKTGLLSGTFNFSIYANDSRGISSVSETKSVMVNRITTFNLTIDRLTGNVSQTNTSTAPSGNVTVTIFNGTNATLNGIPLDSISIDSLDRLNTTYIDKLRNQDLKPAGENLTLGPAGARFVPDIQIRFNYTKAQLKAANITAESLRVISFNTTTGKWDNVSFKLYKDFILANVSHFSDIVLAYVPPTPPPPPPSPPRNIPGSSGSGSIGGAGVISKESVENIEKYETKSNQIANDTASIYKFTPLEGGVYEIEVVGNKTEGDISIRVEHLEGRSKLISEPAPESVYYYLNVWPGTEDIKEAKIRFKVEKSWIASQKLANVEVKMFKWDGSRWGQLDTFEIKEKEDATHIYYEARSNSLSQLAVVGVKAGPTPTPTSGGTAATASPTTPQTATPPDTSKSEIPNAPFNLNIILVAFAVILGIIIIVLGMIAAPTVKSISSEQFIGKSSEEYGEKYHEHLLEQYKLYVNMADKVSERRQSTNNYFILFNSFLVSVFGVLSGFESMSKQHMWQYLLLFAGFLVSIIWGTLIGSSRQLNSVKLTLIHEVESRLPAALYNSEWNILGECKRRRCLSFAHMEQFVPWIFAGIYILLMAIALWNLSG